MPEVPDPYDDSRLDEMLLRQERPKITGDVSEARVEMERLVVLGLLKSMSPPEARVCAKALVGQFEYRVRQDAEKKALAEIREELRECGIESAFFPRRLTYTVVARRTGNWFALEVPDLPGVFSQVREIERASGAARQAISAMLDVDVDEIRVKVQLANSEDASAEDCDESTQTG